VGKLLALVGTTIGSAIGWWLGAPAGLMTAFICSMVGFGIGLYAARRITHEYFE
jgi:phosphate/sulfate permease